MFPKREDFRNPVFLSRRDVLLVIEVDALQEASTP